MGYSNIRKSDKLIFLVLLLLQIMRSLDASAINLVIPKLSYAFAMSMNITNWIIIISQIVSASFVVTTGKLSDLYGEKRLFLYGLTLLVVGSFIMVFAINQWMLLIGRGIQGLGIAVISPIIHTVVFSLFPSRPKGYGLGFLISTTSVTLAVGPIFWGVVLECAPWQLIFLLNILIGLLSMILIMLFFPTKRVDYGHKLDFIPMAHSWLFFLATTLMLVGLNGCLTADSKTWLAVLAVVLGMSMMLFFVKIDKKQSHPFFMQEIFKRPDFMLAVLINALYAITYFGTLFILTLYLQNILGYSPLVAGLLFCIMAFTSATISPQTSWLIKKFTEEKVMKFGFVLMVIFYLLLLLTSYKPKIGFLALTMVVFGCGFGCIFPVIISRILSLVPSGQNNSYFGISQSAASIAKGVGVIVVSSLLKYGSGYSLGQWLNSNHFHLTQPQMNELELFTYGIKPMALIRSMEITSIDASNLHELLIQFFNNGLSLSIIFCLVISIVGVFLSHRLQILVKPNS